MKNKLLTILSTALLAGSMGANADFIASYGSGVSGSTVGGTFTSDAAIFQVGHEAYFKEQTTPPSIWVWGDDPQGFATINFTFNFDLTGYDPETATLSGLWGADNIGTISLNGHVISTLAEVIIENFYYSTPFFTDDGSYFNPGANSLVFNISNAGGQGAFRSGGSVYADIALQPEAPDLAQVSEPASLTLAALGLAGLGFSRRRKA